MSTPTAAAASKLASVFPRTIASAPLWPTRISAGIARTRRSSGSPRPGLPLAPRAAARARLAAATVDRARPASKPSRADCAMCSRANAMIALSCASLTSASWRHGSTAAAKHDSDFQMLPTPASVRWSSSASPTGRVGSSARSRASTSRASKRSPIMSGPSSARRGSKRRRDGVINSSSGPSNCTTTSSACSITSHARRAARCQRCPRR